jgi:hypothetical protein
VAIALVQSGHRVRILAGGSGDRHHGDEMAIETLLDQVVDLVGPQDAVTARSWLLTSIEELTQQGAGSELVVAIFGALDTRTQSDLARIAVVHDGWAMVRTGALAAPVEELTLQALRRGGWTACLVRPGEPVRTAWQRLRDTGDFVVGAHR